MTYTLPQPPRRVWLRAFWLTLMMGAGLVMLGLRLAIGPGMAWLGLSSAMVALLAAGTISRRIRRKAYDVWARGADRYARVASMVLTRIVFLIVSAGSRAGSRMRMSAPEAGEGETSGWVGRRSMASPPEYRSPHFDPAASGSWAAATMAWARNTGNLWFLWVLPYLAFLRRVETRQVRSLGGNIYTLY